MAGLWRAGLRQMKRGLVEDYIKPRSLPAKLLNSVYFYPALATLNGHYALFCVDRVTFLVILFMYFFACDV